MPVEGSKLGNWEVGNTWINLLCFKLWVRDLCAMCDECMGSSPIDLLMLLDILATGLILYHNSEPAEPYTVDRDPGKSDRGRAYDARELISCAPDDSF
jgi:hypothetical protein